MRIALRALLCLLAAAAGGRADTVRIAGSTIVSQLVIEAAEQLRKANPELKFEIEPQGSSDSGLTALGSELAEVAMISRRVTPEDRARCPGVKIAEFYVGAQVVAFGVPADVWEGGVKALSAEEARRIYEKKTRSWKAVGGADDPITFINWPPGRGVWELFTQHLYGDNRRASPGNFETASTHEAIRNVVQFTRGGIAPISPLWLDAKTVFPLGVKTSAGEVITVSPETISDGRWPMVRPLVLLVHIRPTRGNKKLIDFLYSEAGQPVFRRLGLYTAAELGVTPPEY